ncbi:MAG: short-chain fatty acid transporter [Firmicutes bacterium]|nr:short-chain fatty acid transporter [Bacillota bacterium]
MRNALRKISNGLNLGMDKVLPDAIVLAFILTFITFVMGIILTDSSPLDMIVYWGSGFWGFLSFSMQMAMIIATGYIVAEAPPVKRGLVKLCKIPKNCIQGVIFIAIASAILGWISWGLGLVAGAILARSVALNLRNVDFKLYVAVAYTGAITTGLFGISGSEFLLVNTPGYFMEDMLGLIPLSETVFEPSLLIAQFIGLIIVVPLIAALIHTDPKDTPEMDAATLDRFLEQEKAVLEMKKNHKSKNEMTFAERVDNSPVTTMIIGLGGLVYLVYWFSTQGFNLTLDIMNFLLLTVGIIGHGSPRNLLNACEEGVRSAYGVLIQFPFYAGIQGMMGSSGLVALIANAFATNSTAASFPYLCYFCMAVINFFIPSSGGIFMVAGPALGQAALDLGVEANKFLISFTAGETISNIIQPFWAIPLLGIAGLKMKDIMGYCIVFFVLLTAIFFGTWAVMW